MKNENENEKSLIAKLIHGCKVHTFLINNNNKLKKYTNTIYRAKSRRTTHLYKISHTHLSSLKSVAF